MGNKLLGFSALMFLGLLLTQSVISVFVFGFQLKKIRRAFKWETFNSLPNEQLTLVKVAKALEQNPNQYFQRKHSREFSFMGEMYDVVRQTDSPDTTFYYCFHDTQESHIMRHINQWMHNNFGKNSSTPSKKMMHEIFKQPYLPVVEFMVFFVLKKFVSISDNPFFVPGFSPDLNSPPPEMS